MAMKYVAYYRVSTKRQPLGLEAQRERIMSFIGQEQCASLISEYEEKESGKEDYRPQLQKALEHCKREDAVLLVAKLDRLSRRVSFIFALKECAVRFRALDLPETCDVLTLAIYSGLAEQERNLISQRTKAALASLKANGVKLGKDNLTNEGRAKGVAALKEKAANNPNNIAAKSRAKELANDGISYYQIAQRLNNEGYLTARGKQHTYISVQRLLKAVIQ